MQNFITWIGNLTFSDWTGFLSLIVAVIVGFFIKNTLVKHIKKNVKAERGSVAFGDNAEKNTITINNSTSEKGNNDV